MAEGRGVLLLGAHLGSFEALRVLSLEHPGARVRVVLDKSQTPAMTELLHSLNPRIAAGVIDASGGGTQVVLALKDAAEQGDLIALLADRARPQEPTRRAPFFGRPAPFPVAPYLIASACRCRACCVSACTAAATATICTSSALPTRPRSARGREAQLEDQLRRYAARLEHPRAWPPTTGSISMISGTATTLARLLMALPTASLAGPDPATSWPRWRGRRRPPRPMRKCASSIC